MFTIDYLSKLFQLSKINDAVVGIVLAVMGRKKAAEADAPKGLATAGLVLSIIGAVLSVIGVVACAICYSAANSVAEVKKLLNYNATSIDLVISSLESYSSLADQSKDSLVKSRNEAVDMERQLAALITDIKSIGDNEAYQKFVNLFGYNQKTLSSFFE